MRKYLYLIKKKKIKSWLKFWLLTKDQVKYVLSEILEGFSFNLQNTVKKRFKIFNIFGNSVQNGTPTPENPVPIHSVADDVNLFDLKNFLSDRNVSYTENEDGSLTFITSSDLYLSPLQFSNEDIIVSMSGILTTLEEMSNAKIEILNSNNIVVGQINLSNSKIENITGSKLRFNMTSNKTITLRNIKLQKGTIATPYSEYGKGTVTIKQRGKNLIDNNNLQYDFSNVPNTYNQLETIETGIRYSTTYSSGTPMIIFNTGIDLTSHIGKTIKMKSTISSNAGSIRVGIANADTSLRQYKANTNISNEEISFLVTDDLGEKKYLIYYLAIDVGIGNTSDFKNLTLTIDEEPIYEPYQGNDYTFQTSPLRSLPNGVRDGLEDDGIHRRVGRIILNGTEDWILHHTSSNGINEFKLSNIPNGNRESDTTNYALLCSHLVSRTQGDIYNGNAGVQLLGGTVNSMYLCLGTTDTLVDFKTWLSTHNIEVLYQLAEEIIEPFTEEQQEQYNKIKKLYTFDGTTNIYSDDEVPPYLQIQYYMKGE